MSYVWSSQRVSMQEPQGQDHGEFTRRSSGAVCCQDEADGTEFMNCRQCGRAMKIYKREKVEKREYIYYRCDYGHPAELACDASHVLADSIWEYIWGGPYG